MPVSIVVGGQFGSEGKGKVALEIVRLHERASTTVVRVGGANSGHTAYDRGGRKWVLRQMPAACVDRNVDVVFPAGSYIDPALLLREMADLDYPRERVRISPFARVVTSEHRAWEQESGLAKTIGSTGSGVGAAVLAAAARNATNFPLTSPEAGKDELLQPFTYDVSQLLHERLLNGERVIIEGTQGYGLSLLDGGFWPHSTARWTTAAGALAEAGLSPTSVDDITLVIRSYPIRVAGASGPLERELSWEELGHRTGKNGLEEYTTVTRKLRRVGEFNAHLVKRAVAANGPTRIVLNHMDYVGDEGDIDDSGSEVRAFLERVVAQVGKIDWLGFSAEGVIRNRWHFPSAGGEKS